MSNVKTFVDVEKPVRDWLRGLGTGVGTRVFLGLPDRCTYPAADLLLLDGGIQAGEAPLADTFWTISIWGGARPAAADAAWELANAVENLVPGTGLDSPVTVYGMGGQVTLGPVYRPDPDDNRARYLLDIRLTIRPA